MRGSAGQRTSLTHVNHDVPSSYVESEELRSVEDWFRLQAAEHTAEKEKLELQIIDLKQDLEERLKQRNIIANHATELEKALSAKQNDGTASGIVASEEHAA